MVIEVGPGGTVKTEERTSLPLLKPPTADACTQTERPLPASVARKADPGAPLLLVHFELCQFSQQLQEVH